MVFTADNQTVKSYVLLIREGKRTPEDVPKLFNLKEVVSKCLNQ